MYILFVLNSYICTFKYRLVTKNRRHIFKFDRKKMIQKNLRKNNMVYFFSFLTNIIGKNNYIS